MFNLLTSLLNMMIISPLKEMRRGGGGGRGRGNFNKIIKNSMTITTKCSTIYLMLALKRPKLKILLSNLVKTHNG